MIRIPRSNLLESVSWLSSQNRAVTLGEWIAVHTPEVAKRFGFVPVRQLPSVPDISDLTEIEARALAITRLVRRNLNNRFSDGNSNASYLHEVLSGSEKGDQVISDELAAIDLLQKLAYAGKLEPQPASP